MSEDEFDTIDREAVQMLAMLLRAEHDGTANPALLKLGPYTAYVLIGAIQLACRHPEMDRLTDKHLRAVVDQLTPLFAPFPALAESVRRGWHE